MNDLTISNIQNVFPSLNAPEKKQLEEPKGSFGDYIKQSLKEVNRELVTADQAIEDLTTGRKKDIHGTMIAMQKAEISFELVMQVRNKIFSAYDEIRKMSI